MNFRQLSAWLVLSWLGIGLSPFVHAAETKRPNIVFAFADDWGRHAGAYARVDGSGTVNDLLHTPHFDRVASDGVLFRKAFVSAPSCTPCRSALLSGQHFWRTGRAAILRGAVWDGSQPAFPLLLREAGYHLGKSYKVWSPGRPNDAPFGGQQHAYESAGRQFNQFSQNVARRVAEGKSVAEAKAELYDEVRKNFDAFLDDRRPGQPFFYWFGPVNVHRKWIKGSGRELWGLDPEGLRGKMPPYLPDSPGSKNGCLANCAAPVIHAWWTTGASSRTRRWPDRPRTSAARLRRNCGADPSPTRRFQAVSSMRIIPFPREIRSLGWGGPPLHKPAFGRWRLSATRSGRRRAGGGVHSGLRHRPEPLRLDQVPVGTMSRRGSTRRQPHSGVLRRITTV